MGFTLLPEFRERLNMPMVVTGAGGWLGRAALEMLDAAGLGGQVSVFASNAREIVLSSGRVVAARDYGELEHLRAPPALVLHFAFLTRGFAGRPDYVAVNRKISAVMQGFLARNGAKGVFVPSSGAVYGPGRVLARDILANPYGVLKLEDEAGFGAVCRKAGIALAMLRIFNLAGPWMNNLSGYALASIIADVVRGEKVVLRASRPVWRSYAHVADVLNVALGVLLRGVEVPVLDTRGEIAVEIGALAEKISLWLAGRGVEITRPEWRDGVADYYVGEAGKFARLAEGLGLRLQDLEGQVRDTAAWMAGPLPMPAA